MKWSRKTKARLSACDTLEHPCSHKRRGVLTKWMIKISSANQLTHGHSDPGHKAIVSVIKEGKKAYFSG